MNFNIAPWRKEAFYVGPDARAAKEKGAPTTALLVESRCDYGSQTHRHHYIPVIVLFLGDGSELRL